MNNYLFIYIL